MSSLLRHPVAIGSVLLSVLLGLLMTFGYLGAFAAPEENLEDLPVGLVNLDQPVEVVGQPLNAGQQFAQQLTANQVPEIEWRTYDSAAEAQDAVDDNKVNGALIVPAELSADVAALATALAAGQAPGDPAQVQFVHNPGVGLFPDTVAVEAANAAVSQLSTTVNQQLVGQLGALGVTLPPASAQSLAEPVALDNVESPTLTTHAGRGLTPVYTAVMLTLTGLVAVSLLHAVLSNMSGDLVLEVLGRRLRLGEISRSPVQQWAICAVLSLIVAVLAGLLIPWFVVKVIGAQAGPLPPFLPFAILGIAAIALMCLVFLTAFGLIGELPSLLVTTIFGVPSAGGVYPLDAVPAFFQFLGSFLPMRYMTDGLRSLYFFDGRGAAGLDRAYVVLALWAIGSAVVGYVVARWLTVREARTATSTRRTPRRAVPVTAPG